MASATTTTTFSPILDVQPKVEVQVVVPSAESPELTLNPMNPVQSPQPFPFPSTLVIVMLVMFVGVFFIMDT